MVILINGKETTLPDNTSLKGAVALFPGKPEHVIAEVDGIIINHNSWDTTLLQNKSRVELITFVGGG